MKQSHTNKRYSALSLGLVAITMISLWLVIRGANTSQELRQKAAVPAGPASIKLSPGSTTLPIGTRSMIRMDVALPSTKIDGIQIIATASGSIPSDFQFRYQPVQNAVVLVNTLAKTGTRATLKLAIASADPLIPLGGLSVLPIGQFSFTPQTSGSITFTFDYAQSIIAENGTTNDILTIPASARYIFRTSYSTPTPTPSGIIRPTAFITPTPTISDRTRCTTNADCGCALDISTRACAIENTRYLTGRCMIPDFCSGISGRCKPSCVSGSCRLTCTQPPTASGSAF